MIFRQSYIKKNIIDHASERQTLWMRSIIYLLGCGFIISIIIMRFFQLQVLEYEDYQTRSEDNRFQLRAIPPSRGLIFDRHGKILAENLPAFRLEIIPEQVDDLDRTIDELRQLITLSDKEVKEFFNLIKKKRKFDPVAVRFRLTEQEIARFAVNQHKFPGVVVTPYLTRYYPYADIMTHVVGYVGRMNSNDLQQYDDKEYLGTTHVGKDGIEKRYESLLHGHVGHEQLETNVRGRNVRTIDQLPSVPGKNLMLTIDTELQKIAMDAFGNHIGSVVALDPNNGEILVLVSMPSFNPNLFVYGLDQKTYQALAKSANKPFINRSIAGTYSPGSTIKPFIALAGLESGVDYIGRKVISNGYYQLPGQDIKYHDWKLSGHGKVDLVDSLTQSVNVYFYDLAVKLGIDQIHQYLTQFGFGNKTGIDLIGEFSGLLPSRDWKKQQLNEPWYPGETVITGIGQGFIKVTPLQLAVAASVLANKGNLVHPHLLIKPDDDETTNSIITTTEKRIPINNIKHWDTVELGMVGVVHHVKGTANSIANDIDFMMAGKTGTAQIANRKTRQQASDNNNLLLNHGLFIAYAPVDNPKIAIAVIVEHGGSGGAAAVPIAKAIISSYLQDEA